MLTCLKLTSVLGSTWRLYTFTGRCIPRPISFCLTSANTVSYLVVACVTTVGGYLSKCCSSTVINNAIRWISQSATVHNCQKCITSCKINVTWYIITHYSYQHMCLVYENMYNESFLHFEKCTLTIIRVNIQTYTPWQVGALPFHSPAAWQVRVLSPTRL